jgi:hypothetical protein
MDTELSFGQRIDGDSGLIECWFTWGALDAIKEMDLTDKVIWMFGAGMGDVWLSRRCKELHVVERNEDWLNKCMANKIANQADNLSYYYRPCNDSSGVDEMYCEVPIKVDVLINDDAYRFEVIQKALTLPRPLTLITDNWMQDYVFLCPKGEELLKEFEHNIYPCTTHTDHEGNCWKTAIHFLK